MSRIWKAEVTLEQTVDIEVDVDKLCSTYHTERAEFDGTDEEFVKDSLYEMGSDLFESRSVVDDGITIRSEDQNMDVWLRVPRAVEETA